VNEKERKRKGKMNPMEMVKHTQNVENKGKKDTRELKICVIVMGRGK
jgi:hypothetical protein